MWRYPWNPVKCFAWSCYCFVFELHYWKIQFCYLIKQSGFIITEKRLITLRIGYCSQFTVSVIKQNTSSVRINNFPQSFIGVIDKSEAFARSVSYTRDLFARIVYGDSVSVLILSFYQITVWVKILFAAVFKAHNKSCIWRICVIVQHNAAVEFTCKAVRRSCLLEEANGSVSVNILIRIRRQLLTCNGFDPLENIQRESAANLHIKESSRSIFAVGRINMRYAYGGNKTVCWHILMNICQTSVIGIDVCCTWIAERNGFVIPIAFNAWIVYIIYRYDRIVWNDISWSIERGLFVNALIRWSKNQAVILTVFIPFLCYFRYIEIVFRAHTADEFSIIHNRHSAQFGIRLVSPIYCFNIPRQLTFIYIHERRIITEASRPVLDKLYISISDNTQIGQSR